MEKILLATLLLENCLVYLPNLVIKTLVHINQNEMKVARIISEKNEEKKTCFNRKKFKNK